MGRVKREKIESGRDSRTLILQTTARLLRTQGYSATGLNQIIDESHAPKGSIYHYFPSGKEEMAGEAIELAGQAIIAHLRQLSETNPSDLLEIFVEAAIHDLEESNYQSGCPIATVALESVASSPLLRETCSRLFKQIQDVIQGALKRQGIADEHLQSLALCILSTYEGAVMLSKVHHDPQPLRLVVPQIEALLATYQIRGKG